MAIPRNLRYELTKYRKGRRHSRGTIVPGVPYSSFNRSRRYVSGMPYIPRHSSHDNLYMCGLPEDYRPSLNAPSVQSIEYDDYQPLEIHHRPMSHHPRSAFDFRENSTENPMQITVPEDDLTLTEQFLMAMGKRSDIEQVNLEEPRSNINGQNLEEISPLDSRIPVDLLGIDELPDLETLKDAFLQLTENLPEDHPDRINVTMAMRKVRDHKIAMSEMEESDAENEQEQFDPTQEAEQLFEQQMQLLEKPFGELAEEPFEELFHEEGFDSTVDSEMVTDAIEGFVTSPELMPYEMFSNELVEQELPFEQIAPEENLIEAPLEELVEQEIMQDEMLNEQGMAGIMPQAGLEQAVFNNGEMAGEINQAIDQVTEEPFHDEIEPDSMQYGPLMAPEYMFEDQYMPDYMALGFGPMGPMPGPMFGP